MKIKNYEWNGFGFPIVFEELPGVKLRGELVPDVNWDEIAKPIVQFICGSQEVPFSGNQVKFIRMHLGMSLREFAKFMGVTHQSVMRWEEKAKAIAHIDAHTEIVMRIKVLKALHSDSKTIDQAVEKVEEVEKFKGTTYKQFKPLHVPEKVIHAAI
jgi:transcriptional regulator with XRE-family HTH domain